MINELEGLTGSSFNGKPTMRTGDKSPERSGWEFWPGPFWSKRWTIWRPLLDTANNARGPLPALAVRHATTHEAGKEGRLAVF
jgi:hypothetical protein